MTQRIVLHSSTNRIGVLVLVCFFLSGLTGLIYEILWTRLIVKIIGGAPFAVSIVLTVFMGGLGLGSFLASRTIDRIDKPAKLVKIYGILELIIGAYALAIPALLAGFRPLYAIIYNHLFGHFILYNLLTFIGCTILLCVPVICMGATLPILCRFYVTKLSHLGARAGRLYGLNTIGAALGALLCGFWLISLFGMWGTLIFAVAINAMIGLSCLLAGSMVKEQRPDTEPIDSDLQQYSPRDVSQMVEPLRYPPVVIAALMIFGVSGFCAMSYEVIWTKLLGLIVGPTTYSFTIVLVTFIFGLALGSMVFGRLADKTGQPIRLLMFTQIGAALFVLVTSQLLGNSQLFFAKVIFSFRHQFALLSVAKTVILFAFMILPTLFLGATFPLVGKIYTQSISKVGRSIGVAYSINTVGAVLGSFCAGFVLIPVMGKENSLRLVIGMQLFTSLVIAMVVLRKESVSRLIPFAAPALAGLLLCFPFPTWNRRVLSTSKYRRVEKIQESIENTGWLESLLHGPSILAKSQHGDIVFYGDGIGGFTTVLKHTGPTGNTEYSLIISGKADASSRGDMKTQTLLAHFPMLFQQNAKTVMVLGLASGVTAGEVLYYPVEQLDVIDINQQVVSASSFFLPWNNNVLSNPKTKLIIQDARAHLQLTKQKYDVIISEPSNPWMAGLATLFTRDFFALAENALSSDGIFVQFVHIYEMNWPTFALIGRAFAQLFPNSLLVATEPFGHSNDYLLVGFKGRDRLTLENAKQNIAYALRSKNITLRDPKLLYRLIVSENIQALFGDGPSNTDNWPRLEFAAPKLIHQKDPTIEKNIKSKGWLSPETRDIIRQVTTDVDSQIDFAAYALSLNAPFPNMVDLSKAAPVQKERFFKLLDRHCACEIVDFTVFDDQELKQRCRAIQIETLENKIALMPDKALSYFHLGDLCYANSMLDEAVANYSKSLLIKPDSAEVHFSLAIVLNKQEKFNEALKHFTEARRIRPDFAAMTHKHLGYVLFRQGSLNKSVSEYQKFLLVHPEDAHIHNDIGVVFAHWGKVDDAIRHFTEAVRIKPDFAPARKHLENALAWRKKLYNNTAKFTDALQPDPNASRETIKL